MNAAAQRSERAQRILDAVEQRAAEGGVRSVVMSEIATDLQMSTKTLYKEFPTKDALVTSLLQRWVHRFTRAQDREVEAGVPATERIKARARILLEFSSRYSESFWADVRQDHPEAWREYTAAVEQARRRARRQIAAELRADVPKELATPMLFAMIERAVADEVRATTGLSLEESIDAAVELWAHGVMAPRQD